jgi:hypothetical protein
VSPDYVNHHYSNYLDYEILQSLGILTRITVNSIETEGEEDEWEIDVDFYRFTTLGVHFVEACKMLSEVDG